MTFQTPENVKTYIEHRLNGCVDSFYQLEVNGNKLYIKPQFGCCMTQPAEDLIPVDNDQYCVYDGDTGMFNVPEFGIELGTGSASMVLAEPRQVEWKDGENNWELAHTLNSLLSYYRCKQEIAQAYCQHNKATWAV